MMQISDNNEILLQIGDKNNLLIIIQKNQYGKLYNMFKVNHT